jgi:ribosome-associated translation inhibitor RaiA
MHVQVNTSNGIDNKDTLERFAADYLNERLSRFRQDITGVEVQMSDENQGDKGGTSDKRCMMEARVNGREPIAVTNFAPDQDLAFPGAADKLERAIDHAFGKLDRREHRDRETIRRDADAIS